jgi:hypothetical protein
LAELLGDRPVVAVKTTLPSRLEPDPDRAAPSWLRRRQRWRRIRPRRRSGSSAATGREGDRQLGIETVTSPASTALDEGVWVDSDPGRIGGLPRAAYPLGLLERDGEIRTRRVGNADKGTDLILGDRHWSENLGTIRQRREVKKLGHRSVGTVDRGHPYRGREPERCPVPQLALGMPLGRPPNECLHRASRPIRHYHNSAVGPDERGGGEPAAQRLLGGAQISPTEKDPPVEQERCRITAAGDWLGARRRDDERRASGDARSPVLTGRRDHGDRRKSPAELLGSAVRPEHPRPQPTLTALRTSPVACDETAPRA